MATCTIQHNTIINKIMGKCHNNNHNIVDNTIINKIMGKCHNNNHNIVDNNIINNVRILRDPIL